MTEAGWTRNADVKESGFYWLVWAERLPQVVQVREASVHFTSGLTISLEEVNGQFLGPITPDSYQQGRVASCEWKYDDMDDYYETACKNAYCLADGTLKDNDHKYCPYCGGLIQLAQQAQKEVGDGKEGKEGL